MRFEGILTNWNDDRGFGYIESTQGGEPIFVHVSAWPKGAGRPRLRQAVSFEIEVGTKGSHLLDPNLNGSYSIHLEALNANGGLLARSEIDVIVGTGADVPEPGSLALALCALGGLLLAARRRRR